jgi:tetratricopeptide (TPR) repeat protein
MAPTLILLLLAAVCVSVVVVLRRSHRKRAALLEQVDEALKNGNYREAAEMLGRAERSGKESASTIQLRLRHARALLFQERYEEAERICRELAESATAPAARALALVELGRCLAVYGSFEAALTALDESERAANGDRVVAARALVAADVALARLRFDRAELALAVVYDPSNASPHTGEAFVGHARLQYLRGNFHHAIAEINRVLERLEGDDLQALALITLARALLDQERPAAVEADQAISSALVLVRFPGYAAVATACHALVQARFENERDALEAIERATRLCVSPRFGAEAHCLVGDALRELGRVAEARTHYQQSLGLDEGQLEALWGLGKCAELAGLAEIADSYFRICFETAPEHFIGRRSENAIEP